MTISRNGRKDEMKKLITAKTIADFAVKGEEFFLIDEDTLITPSAKDLARNKGITFVTSEEASALGQEKKPCNEEVKACVEEVRKTVETVVAEGGKAMTYDRQLIVEAVIKALDKKGILAQILDK